MKFLKPPRYQNIGWWVSMPLITFALSYILYEDRIFSEPQILLVTFPIIYFLGYISFRGHYLYDYWLISKYPRIEDTSRRIWYKLPINVLVMTPSVLIIFLVFHFFRIYEYRVTFEDLWYGYLVGLSVNIVFESLWEVIYIIDKYKETAADQERIEQLQIQQEFDNLKQKVNPHFLFNSFNTLSSLISENPDRAERFLDELSKVYRYLLRSNESGMSTVEQETKFIESYAKLLETRHGEGFQLDIKIDPAFRDRQIPSLTLQLLVENAVKHNIISRQQPVKVLIHSLPEGSLVVENNLNKKTKPLGESTGIGLSNIREKYRLLGHPEVNIGETNGHFIVKIPLLN